VFVVSKPSQVAHTVLSGRLAEDATRHGEDGTDSFDGMEDEVSKDIILTLDFNDHVVSEDRVCDAEYIDQIITKAAQRNVTTVLWRTMAGPRGLYRSRSVPTFEDQEMNLHPNWKGLLDVVDPLQAAVTSAHAHGLKILAFAPLQDYHIVRTDQKNTSPFYDQRPYLNWLKFDGTQTYMGIPCYAYDEARRYYLDHIEEVLNYGVDGVYVCFRSHAGEPAVADDHAADEDDSYGYNEPWMQQIRGELGISPSPGTIRASSWLSRRMQMLRGRSYTILLQGVRELVGSKPLWVGVAEEPDLLIAGNTEKDRPAHHRVRLDVSGWCRNGLVDAVLVVTGRSNPCDPSPAELYRDATARFGKSLYAWLNMIAFFRGPDGSAQKRTPTPDELRAIVRSAEDACVDGLVLHEVLGLEFSYLKRAPGDVLRGPHHDRDAQWDALMG